MRLKRARANVTVVAGTLAALLLSTFMLPTTTSNIVPETAMLAATPANPLAPILVTPSLVGFPSDGALSRPDASRDGRVVAFLFEGKDGTSVWLKDAAGSFIRADRGPSKKAVPAAEDLSLSGDGSLVVFTSTSPDLVAGFDPKGIPQLFRYNRHLGWIDAPLRGIDGGPLDAPVRDVAASYDGTHLGFVSAASNIGAGQLEYRQVFLYSSLYTTPSKVRMVSMTPEGKPANYDSAKPSLGRSEGGLVVSYASLADDLVAGDRNDSSDVFFWAETSGKSALVSKTSKLDAYPLTSSSTSSGQAELDVHSISGDGRFITFTSNTPYVVSDKNFTFDVYVYDRITGVYRRASTTSAETDSNIGASNAHISSDGKHVVFTGAEDLFLGAQAPQVANVVARHFDTGTLSRAARGLAGGPLVVGEDLYSADYKTISTDGTISYFITDAPLDPTDTDGLPDIYKTVSSTGSVWVAPATKVVNPGQTVTVRVTGAGFTGVSAAQMNAPGAFAPPGAGTSGYDPVVQRVTFVSSTAVDVTVMIPAAAHTKVKGVKAVNDAVYMHGISLQRADGQVGGLSNYLIVEKK